MVTNTKLNRDIREIVENVVTPRFNGIDTALKTIDAKLNALTPPPAKP